MSVISQFHTGILFSLPVELLCIVISLLSVTEMLYICQSLKYQNTTWVEGLTYI